jgi:glycosidase
MWPTKFCALKEYSIRLILTCIVALPVIAQASLAVVADAPEVLKVEPPNWWAGHSVAPVRLLIRGRHLKNARVEVTKRGVKVGNIRINEAGTYLFVDVTIDRRAAEGSYPIRIMTAAGSAQAPFEITAPLSRSGNFLGFNQDDVIYLIMPDRFANGDSSNDDPPSSRGLFDRSKSRYYHGGDLQGVINRLPYLKDLGVTAIWLNPIYDNNNRLNDREQYPEQPGGPKTPITDYHGYGAVDFYAVDEHFGDLNKFRELVEAAHKLGIKIIQDQVANHTGPYHPWIKDSPTPTWFHGTEADHIDENWQTNLLMDQYATDELKKPVLDGWFINILPDLNQDDPEVAKYIIQNTLWWIGMTGIDGIRQDTLPYVPRSFWREWMTAIKREYPHVNVVGETLDGLPSQVAFFQGGVTRFDGIDSKIDTEFDYPLFFSLRRVFGEGQSIRQLVEILKQDYLYPAPQNLVTLLGSHDVLRFMNERDATIEGLKLAFTFILTVRGIPQLYYGDEIAMRGGNDPDNRRDFPGGWANDPRSAFEQSGRSSEEQGVYQHVKEALRLRAELEPLRRGRTAHLAIEDQAYVFARFTDRKSVIVAINNGTQPAAIEAVIPRIIKIPNGSILKNRLSAAAQVKVENGGIKLRLAPRAAVILE